jgi:hypothetical protein
VTYRSARDGALLEVKVRVPSHEPDCDVQSLAVSVRLGTGKFPDEPLPVATRLPRRPALRGIQRNQAERNRDCKCWEGFAKWRRTMVFRLSSQRVMHLSNQRLQADVILAYARNHAADRQDVQPAGEEIVPSILIEVRRTRSQEQDVALMDAVHSARA